MRVLLLTIAFCCSLLLVISPVSGSDGEGFDTEKMILELQEKLKLSQEQWEKLKPVLGEKSMEMKQRLHESIDKGYLELEELSRKLDEKTKDAEATVKDILSSEEAQKLRVYLGSIDQEAIRQMKDNLVAELTAVLELSEEQAAKLKPVLEDGLTRMSELLNEAINEGVKSWDEFREKFDRLSRDFQEKMKDTLDDKQMERFKKYNEEQKTNIHQALFTI